MFIRRAVNITKKGPNKYFHYGPRFVLYPRSGFAKRVASLFCCLVCVSVKATNNTEAVLLKYVVIYAISVL